MAEQPALRDDRQRRLAVAVEDQKLASEKNLKLAELARMAVTAGEALLGP
jgi:hypothetical protein